MRAYIVSVPKRKRAIDRIIGQFMQMPSIDSVSLSIDHHYNGCWWNVSRTLQMVAASGEPGLVMSDDVVLMCGRIEKTLGEVEGHLKDFGLISLFTPPRKSMEEAQAAGYNGIAGTEFLWPQLFIVRPDFAQMVVDADTMMDQAKAKQYDEVRFRYASQTHGVDMLTLIGSHADHDLLLPSILGTPAKIGTVVRNTRLYASDGDDYSTLNLKWSKSSKDLKEYSK